MHNIRSSKSAIQTAELRISQANKSHSVLLDLLGLGLDTLPESISKLPRLRILQLSYNQISDIPPFIGDLPALRELDISRNLLAELPSAIGDLKNLQTLNVSSNHLSALPIALSNTTKLRFLDISDNKFEAMPDWMQRLMELAHLNVSHNKLTDIPSWISLLANLRYFDLSGNHLEHLPAALGQLSQLEQLNAARIGLTEFPSELCELRNLTTLDLSGNNLRHLPEDLRNLLPNLTSLVLHGNPRLRLPRQILGPAPGGSLFAERVVGAKQILDYYFEAQRDAKMLNEARLIVVGRGFSGKTSIVRQLLGEGFNPNQTKTDGISIQRWPSSKSPGKPQLNIWDFGGQEMMHATHQFFLTENSLYIVVVNGRDGQEDYDVAYWLQLINGLAGNSPVIVVQNKIVEQDFELDYNGLRSRYPQIVGFCKTDCSNGTGIPHLEGYIRIAISDRMPFMRDLFPASWFAVKTQLASMAEDYVSYERYKDLCCSHGLSDPELQDSLARYLHCLGVALNYKDDPRLRETSVLKPRWVTEGIYRVLTNSELASRQGEMFACDLERWLDGQSYPSTKQAFLLELMLKFRLCFSFPNEVDHYLVPDLLAKEQPRITGEFDPTSCLNFEYHYSVLPEGLIPLFIVRTHTLSQGESEWRWRTGVVLTWGESRALIRAFATERRVVINVSGPAAEERRRLLAVIRADFDQIHRLIPSLRVVEKVPLPGYPEDTLDYNDLIVLERTGETNVTKVVNSKGREIVVKPLVSDLLNGVDYGGVQARVRIAANKGRAVRLFISYSRQDEALKKELELHLKLMERTGQLSIWNDRCLIPGEEWDKIIDTNLESADIILLLVSVAFISSNYCYEIEMQKALERHRSGKAVVVPIILRPLNWSNAPFAGLSALPKDGVPVMLSRPRDKAWSNVASGIAEAIENLRRGDV